MNKVKYVRVQQQDGTYLDNVPIGADAQNVSFANGQNLQDTMAETADTLEALDSRMDTFASLPSGSTSGNAELVDIRVGVDGTSYNNAGTAVRTQVNRMTKAKAFINDQNVLQIQNYRTFNSSTIDNPQAIPMVDDTLSITGAAADAKATGDAIQEYKVMIDSSLTVQGRAADAKAVGDALQTNKVTLDSTLKVSNAAADAKAVGDALQANKVTLDSTLKVGGAAADAKAVGDTIEANKVSLDPTLSVYNAAAQARATGNAISGIQTEARVMGNTITSIQQNINAMDQDILNIQAITTQLQTNLNAKVDEIVLSEDRKYIIFKSNSETIAEVGPIAGEGGGGSGGGGGSENNAVMTLTNASGWIAKSIAANTDCNITCEWSSIENDTPTGEGTVTVYVNGISRQTIGVQQGQFTVRVGSLLVSGKNFVRISVADIYGNTRTINYTVVVVNATLSSNFSTTVPFNGDIPFIYQPNGDLTKIVHFILDGNEIGTQEVTTSGRQITYTIPAQSYGNHSLEVYFIGDMDGVEIESNHLYFEIACVDNEHDQPIITSNFSTTTVDQYSTLSIPYRVYTPSSMTTQVVLKVNGTTLNTIVVDRTEQIWSYKADNAGTLVLRIEANSEIYKEFTIQVAESSANIAAETQNLALYLTSNNRNNGEANPATWTYNDIAATFTNFNFVTDGWQLDKENNTVLHLAGDARLTIPYKIFANDFKVTGKTIEIEFATSQVADFDANIISCFADNIGLKITPQSITFRGAQTELSTLYKDNEHIRLSIVIAKQNNYRLILIYINGVMSRAIQYASGERFSQLNPVDITIGSNDCDVDIYNIRVYDNDLNREQVLGNWIADTQNGELRLERYNHNNVYDEYGQILTSTLPKDLPYMILEGPELSQYKGDKKTISVTYTDQQDSSKSFIANNVQLNVQGTSSSVYFRKNYDLQFKEGFVMSGGTQQEYALRTGSIPFNRFVIKADVASSESTNNTGLTMFYNDTCPYKTPEMLENPKVRWGIEGVPIVVYWHNTTTDTFEFLGKHNFNLPKRAPAPYGYANSDTLESWEWERNNSNNVKFKDNDFTTLSWDETEQKYYPEWYNDFEARFPSDEWRDITKLNELISWVKSTDRDAATGDNLSSPVTYKLNSTITVNNYSDDSSYTVTDEMNNGVRTGYSIFRFTKDTPAYRLTKFKAQFDDYFERESAVFYYLFTQLFTMIDSRAKNMFIGFNGSPINISGRAMDRKATIQPYDMDTAVGTNNSGVLMFGYYHEDGDTVSNIISGGDSGGSSAPVYNAQDSVLWSNVRDSFRSELVSMYRNLRTSGAWSYQVVETMYENHQSKWPEAIFNEDAYIKYLYPLVEAVTVDENTGQLIKTDRYLTMLQGSKQEQRKWWLYNRFRYMDSKFNTGNASSSTLDIRLFNSGTLTITPVNDMYVGVAFGLGSTPIMRRVIADESATYEYQQASGVTEMETSIFSGDMITDLGDLSVFYPNECNFAKGVRLKRLKIGDSTAGYSNTNLKVLDVSNSPLLESIDCRNCPELATTINLENSPRLQEAYFDGTAVTGVDLADGCVIETLHLPATITTLTLTNLKKLTDLTIASYSNISRLMLTNIDSSVINPVTALNAIQPNSQVNIQGLALELSTAEDIEDFLDLLDTMSGVTREKDTNGDWLYYEQDTAVVSGTIHTSSLTGAQIASYNARYPYLQINADHVTSYLTYKSYDGATTIKTVTCIDGVPQEAAPAVPARADSADGHYSYTGLGWNTNQDAQSADSSAIVNVIADRTVYAAYQWNVKTYTVTWRNSNGTTLETDTGVAWGTRPTYNGSTPVDPSGQSAPFTSWIPEISNVTGNITYTASYKPIWTVTFKNQAGTSTLQTVNVIDGNTATYTGTTPTNEDQTTFLGWSNSTNSSTADAVLTNIKASKTVYAAFENPEQEITDTWEQIGQAIDNNTYKTKYKVGWYKPLDLGTQGVVNMQIVAMDADTLTAGGTAPLTFVAKEILWTTRKMNSSSTNENGWVATDTMRPYLTNTIMPLIDPLVRMRIQAVNKTYYDYTTTSTLTSSDRLWIPSVREIFGEANGYEDSGVMYTGIYSNANKRKKHSTTSAVNSDWWLRSATSDNAYRFYRVYGSGGGIDIASANTNMGVVIGFCLGAATPNVTEITDTWDQIINAIDTNTYKKYDIGQYKPLDLGTEGTVNMQIVAIDGDELASGGTAPLSFVSKELLNTNRAVGNYNWINMTLRTVLNTDIIGLFPNNVKSRIQKVVKTHICRGTITTQDKLWIPSQYELGFNWRGGYSTNIINYSTIYKDDNSRIKYKLDGSGAFYWVRDNSTSSLQNPSLIHCSTGTLVTGNTTSSYSVCLGFCLGLENETIEDDWATILANQNYTTDYSIGDTKWLDLGTEGKHLMEIVAIDEDNRADGQGKAGLTWISKTLLNTTHRMNPTNNNGAIGTGANGGWENCEMRTYLKETIKPLIPETVRNAIVPVTKIQSTVTDGSKVIDGQTTTDDVWIPSNHEIFGGTSYETTGAIYTTIFKNSAANRIKKRNGSAYDWWTRSANNAYSFRYVGTGGNENYYGASGSDGVALGFCTN